MIVRQGLTIMRLGLCAPEVHAAHFVFTMLLSLLWQYYQYYLQ